MKKKAVVIIVLVVLAVIAAVLAAAVAGSMPEKKPCEVIITENGKQSRIDLTAQKLTDVKGTITMASGKTKEIDAKGIELRHLLEGYSFSAATVIAEDNYSAQLTAEDIEKAQNSYLILDENNKPRLVVMTDTNAKRDVKNVLTIELK